MNYRQLRIRFYGKNIIASQSFLKQKEFIQHGKVTTYDHVMEVTDTCLLISDAFFKKVNEKALVKGALLHDYCLYDWHEDDDSHRLHGFRHPKVAAKNAERDFGLGKIEKDMISKHMFPLTVIPPKYKESWILCIADKICAAKETAYGFRSKLKEAAGSFKKITTEQK